MLINSVTVFGQSYYVGEAVFLCPGLLYFHIIIKKIKLNRGFLFLLRSSYAVRHELVNFWYISTSKNSSRIFSSHTAVSFGKRDVSTSLFLFSSYSDNAW